jgi:hypothetical protein
MVNERDINTTTVTKRRPLSICAHFDGNRFDLSEGRDWLVTTFDHENGEHAYVVTVWVEDGLGRMASCRCKAFGFGNVCRHIRYVQLVDSLLTKAPVREIQPVAA